MISISAKALSLTLGVRALNARSEITGNKALFLAQLYDEGTGFDKAFAYNTTSIDVVDLNETPGTDTSDSTSFNFTTSFDELVTKIEIETSESLATVPVDIEWRQGDSEGTVFLKITNTLTTDTNGKVIIDLANEYNTLNLDVGFDTYFSVECPNMLGVASPAPFIPNATFHLMRIERLDIALANDIPEVVGTSVVAGNDIDVDFSASTGKTIMSYNPVFLMQYHSLTAGLDSIPTADTTELITFVSNTDGPKDYSIVIGGQTVVYVKCAGCGCAL